MFVLQFDTEHRARKHFRNLALYHQMIFFRHYLQFPDSFSVSAIQSGNEPRRNKGRAPKPWGPA